MPFQTIAGAPLFYTDTHQGPSATKTTTVFLHGLGSSSCFYQTIIPQLKTCTRCIAIDYPGSGLSALGNDNQDIPRGVDRISRDAIALLEALGVEDNVIVVGHSMGGMVASQIAVMEEKRVKGVILLGPVDPSESLGRVFSQRIKAVETDGLEALANTIPTAATGSKSTPLHHAFIRSLILGTSRGGYTRLCNVIARAHSPDYSAIKVPLLIVVGSDDKTAPMAMSKDILERYGTEQGNKRLQVLEGVGHWHCVEAPHEVGNSVREFIKDL